MTYFILNLIFYFATFIVSIALLVFNKSEEEITAGIVLLLVSITMFILTLNAARFITFNF